MSDYSSAKFLSKQMKARGLQKLKLYCQVCQKQCRDDNGFRSHIKSPSHLRKIAEVTTDDIDKYSAQFESDFLTHLRVNHGEKPIGANKVYNEFIQDKNHIHMNATEFTSLNKFIQHLSKGGKIKIRNLEDFEGRDEIDMTSLMISYVDNSGNNSLQKEQLQEIEKQEKATQQVKNFLLQRQIEAGLAASKEAELNNAEDHEDEPEPLHVIEPGQDITIDIKPFKKQNKVHKKSKKSKTKNLFG